MQTHSGSRKTRRRTKARERETKTVRQKGTVACEKLMGEKNKIIKRKETAEGGSEVKKE